MSSKLKKIKKNISQREFVKYPDPILREKCGDIEEFNTQELNSLVSKLRTACISEKGIAVAGPQIGVTKNIFFYNLPGGDRGVVINPQIIDFSDELSLFTEGCLSMRGYYWEVERPTHILVEWYNEKGYKKQAAVSDLECRMFQHEIDHLEGTLLLDYLSDEEYDKFEYEYFDLNQRGSMGPLIITE